MRQAADTIEDITRHKHNTSILGLSSVVKGTNPFMVLVSVLPSLPRRDRRRIDPQAFPLLSCFSRFLPQRF